jgi:peptidoglycan/LPS O-acetylase OafA/YrhL
VPDREVESVPLGVGTQLTYMPALDGIRAVSILGIMFNHGGFAWAGGGVISVNVFFVLSGFLITQLLMKEWTRTGTIRLRAFWARRARRLLPALFILLGGIGLYAVVFAPGGSQPSLLGDGISTLFYFGNWHLIQSGQSYFVQVSALSPLLHTWTLAIEEQFYIVWPLVFIGVLKLWRSPRILLAITALGVLASALEMALLFHPGVDPSRLYYGTDTRAQDILVGAFAGIVLSGHGPASGRRARIGFSWLAVAAAAVFALEWWSINRNPSLPFRFGFLAADLMVALVIVAVTKAPRSLPSRMLSVRPLTFVGQISYGLYLWHWPIFLVVNHERTGLENYSLFVLRLIVTFAIAVLSWYFVETPIRQRTFGSWRSWLWAPAGAGVIVVVLLVTTATNNTNPLFGKFGQQAVTSYQTDTFNLQAPQVRVLVVGDSLSQTVGFWIARFGPEYGMTVLGKPLDGCGLATSVPYDLHGTVTYPFLNCADWPKYWESDVDRLKPQVVALVVGWWETMDRMYQGHWQHLGDPAFDKYEKSQLQYAVAVLSSQGARVAIMTAPYFDSGEQLDGQPWDEDSPARVNVLNRIIKSVAAQDPKEISVIPLHKYLDPQGHYTSTIGGKVVRFPDGVHTTEAAGRYLAPKILPQLAALGHAVSGTPGA